MKTFSLILNFIGFLLICKTALSFKDNEQPLGVFVDGYVTGYPQVPFGAHPPFNVYAIRGNDTIDVAQTDANGYYAFQNIPVGINPIEKPNLETKLYPNPYQNSTNIDMFAPKKDNYKLMMLNEKGELIFSRQIELEENSKINITGKNPGMHIIYLQNSDTTYKFKALQTQETSNNIDINITRPSKLKEVAFDEVKFVYVNPKYEKPDTTITLSSSMIHLGNRNIWKLKDTYNFSFFALNYNDTIRSHGAIKINWNNGSGDEITYPAQTTGPNTGKININYESYFDRPDTIFISNADTTLTTNQLWARHQSSINDWSKLNWANKFQSERIDFTGPKEALVNPDSLTGTANLFFLPKQIPHPFLPGQFLRTDGPEFTSYTHSMSPFRSVRYVPVPQVQDSINWFIMRKDLTTSALVSQDKLNIMLEQSDSAQKIRTLSYGVRLLPPLITEVVENENTNVNFQNALARGMDQSNVTQYRTGMNSGAGTYTTTQYAPIVNGVVTGRIYHGYSNYPQNVSFQEMRDEMITNQNNCDDVLNNNATPYVVGSNGENTEFVKVATYKMCMDDPLTPAKSPNKQSNIKYDYDLHIHVK